MKRKRPQQKVREFRRRGWETRFLLPSKQSGKNFHSVRISSAPRFRESSEFSRQKAREFRFPFKTIFFIFLRTSLAPPDSLPPEPKEQKEISCGESLFVTPSFFKLYNLLFCVYIGEAKKKCRVHKKNKEKVKILICRRKKREREG